MEKVHRWLERKKARKDGGPQSWRKDKVRWSWLFLKVDQGQRVQTLVHQWWVEHEQMCFKRLAVLSSSLMPNSVRRIKVGKVCMNTLLVFLNLPDSHMWLKRGFIQKNFIWWRALQKSYRSCWETVGQIPECAHWLFFLFFKIPF